MQTRRSNNCADVLCLDVNVLVVAQRADLPDNDRYGQLLESWANGLEPVGVPDMVLSGFLRVVTNRRIFAEPTTSTEAWDYVERLLASPTVALLRAGERHVTHFRRLATDIEARGSDIADAYLAAYALDNNATFISADRGFARFSRLRWRHPLDG
jgi:toxin-antitoxin system PIN domain toxin